MSNSVAHEGTGTVGGVDPELVPSPATFGPHNVAAAIRAVEAAGEEVLRAWIDESGSIIVTIKPPSPARVYFVQGPPGTPIKVGFVRDGGKIDKRLSALQTGYPHKLRVLCLVEGDARVERTIHKALAAHRLQGEWFRHGPAVHQLIRDLNAGRPLSRALARVGDG